MLDRPLGARQSMFNGKGSPTSTKGRQISTWQMVPFVKVVIV